MIRTAKTLLVAAVLSVGLSGVALARDQVVTIRLAAPVAEPTRVITQNTIWNCEGDTCITATRQGASVRACRAFAREAGLTVVAFGPEGAALTEEELARCNGVAETQEARN